MTNSSESNTTKLIVKPIFKVYRINLSRNTMNIYDRLSMTADPKHSHYFLRRTSIRYCSQFYAESYVRFKKQRNIDYLLRMNLSKEYIDDKFAKFCTYHFGPKLLEITNSAQR